MFPLEKHGGPRGQRVKKARVFRYFPSFFFLIFLPRVRSHTGKYIKLLYDKKFRLIGAKTDHFLLEKSRLVTVDSGERGYHVFYQVGFDKYNIYIYYFILPARTDHRFPLQQYSS